MHQRFLVIGVLVLLSACRESPPAAGDGGEMRDGGTEDASSPSDGGHHVGADAAIPDSGTSDGGVPGDAGLSDGGHHVGADAAIPDSGTSDGGMPGDAGLSDGGAPADGGVGIGTEFLFDSRTPRSNRCETWSRSERAQYAAVRAAGSTLWLATNGRLDAWSGGDTLLAERVEPDGIRPETLSVSGDRVAYASGPRTLRHRVGGAWQSRVFTEDISAVSASVDGVLVATSNGAVHWIDGTDLRELRAAGASPATAVAGDPTGAILNDGVLRVYDGVSWRTLTLPAPSGWQEVAKLANGEFLVRRDASLYRATADSVELVSTAHGCIGGELSVDGHAILTGTCWFDGSDWTALTPLPATSTLAGVSSSLGPIALAETTAETLQAGAWTPIVPPAPPVLPVEISASAASDDGQVWLYGNFGAARFLADAVPLVDGYEGDEIEAAAMGANGERYLFGTINEWDECLDDSDCSSGQRCSSGGCFDDVRCDGDPGGVCGRHSQCVQGFLEVWPTCLPRKPLVRESAEGERTYLGYFADHADDSLSSTGDGVVLLADEPVADSIDPSLTSRADVVTILRGGEPMVRFRYEVSRFSDPRTHYIATSGEDIVHVAWTNLHAISAIEYDLGLPTSDSVAWEWRATHHASQPATIFQSETDTWLRDSSGWQTVAFGQDDLPTVVRGVWPNLVALTPTHVQRRYPDGTWDTIEHGIGFSISVLQQTLWDGEWLYVTDTDSVTRCRPPAR